MAEKKQKFTVVKNVVHGTTIHQAGAKLDLDPESASTKKLLKTGHIADPKAEKGEKPEGDK